MANSIKIGGFSFDALKIGGSDVDAAYIGDTLLYSGGTTPPAFQGKWLATYTGGTTSSAECDSTSAITKNEINKTNLVSLEIGDCVTSIANTAFYGCSSLTSINIPSSVTSIGDSAFQFCSSLTSINIPSGITSIGNSTFYGCSSLTSIEIPNSVTSIGYYAFEYCTSLTRIEIPSGVTSIGNDAFIGCEGLTSIIVNATTPPQLVEGTFNDTNNCPILVPSQSVEAYKSASGWSTYASRIQAIPNS